MGYRLSKGVRLINEVAKKVTAYDRMAQQELYPKGRLRHLKRQISKLEYEIDKRAL